mmetsp:Transcript_21733/g.67494  ORF Transcript_21733/g.67494 Transcript_21733/m.67494 type:complete len:232 (-) Transcript_21733:2292-2987(-)
MALVVGNSCWRRIRECCDKLVAHPRKDWRCSGNGGEHARRIQGRSLGGPRSRLRGPRGRVDGAEFRAVFRVADRVAFLRVALLQLRRRRSRRRVARAVARAGARRGLARRGRRRARRPGARERAAVDRPRRRRLRPLRRGPEASRAPCGRATSPGGRRCGCRRGRLAFALAARHLGLLLRGVLLRLRHGVRPVAIRLAEVLERVLCRRPVLRGHAQQSQDEARERPRVPLV